MFSIVAVPFDAYADLPTAQHRWLLTCFSRYVDKTGRAFPTLRQLARDARMSVASVSRYMTTMAALGVFQRERKPGRRYLYTLAEAYQPRWPGRPKPEEKGGVSRPNEGVSPEAGGGVSQAATQKAKPKKHDQEVAARARGGFAKSGLRRVGGELPDPDDQWRQRVHSWRSSGGRFWFPQWGPKPNEPGCLAPAKVLQAALA